MRKRKLTVTVGIPAHNEEGNIIPLINQILFQTRQYYRLEQIIVLSDASTDKTVKLVKQLKNPLIKVIDSKVQKGKSPRVNQMFRMQKSQVFVQFDADTKISHSQVIDYLVKPFLTAKKPDLVLGWHTPEPGVNWLSDCIAFGAYVWTKALDELGTRGYYYRCVGNVRAFSYRYTKNVTIPASSGEDRLSFWLAKKHNYTVAFAPKALVYFKVPSSLSDFIHQMHRFIISKDVIGQRADQKFIKKYLTMTPGLFLKHWIIQGILNPDKAVGYIVLHSIPKLKSIFDNKAQPLWRRAVTTH